MGGGASASKKYDNASTEPLPERGTDAAGDSSRPSRMQLHEFLEQRHGDEREVLRDLLHRAAASCGGSAYFYSAPGGSGRDVMIRCNPKIRPEDWSTEFFLMASSAAKDKSSKVLEAPRKSHQLALRDALARGFARAGGSVVARVMIDGKIEGMLLMDLPDKHADGSVELWAMLLAERLEKVRLAQEAAAAKASLVNVTECLEGFVVAESDLDDLVEEVATMIPQEVFNGSVKSDHSDLWFLDHDALVLNDDGQQDGLRAPLDHSVVGFAVKSEVKRPICVYNTKLEENFNPELEKSMNFQSTSILCVPFEHPKLQTKAVMAFRNGTVPSKTKKVEPRSIDHFDIVGAERLKESIFPTTLWCRDALLQIFFREKQREALQAVVSDLVLAVDVKTIIEIVQLHVGAVLNCARCTLFFIDHSQQQIWSPESKDQPGGIKVPIGQSLVGQVAQKAIERSAAGDSRKIRRSGCTTCPVGATRTNDPQNDPHWAGDFDPTFKTRNLITAPVWSSGKDRNLIGLIQCLNKGARENHYIFSGASTSTAAFRALAQERSHESTFWTERDAEMLEILAEAVGEHLQRLMLDMMWSKASFDAATDSSDPSSLMQEFYGGGSFKQASKTQTVHKMAGATIFASPSDGAATMHAAPSDCLEVLEVDYSDVLLWEVDYWKLSQKEEFSLIIAALRHCDAVTPFAVADSVLYNFYSTVKSNYNDVPYHSFYHAIATVHYTFKMMQEAKVLDIVETPDIFASIWGALCHDIGHRGRNNAFEVVTRSELALRYNDSSPLENHHCAKAFELALHSRSGMDCNIFQGMDPQTYGRVRKMMVAGILSTDMVHHVDHVRLMQEFVLGPRGSADQSQFLVEVFMHTADISNVMMPEDIALAFTVNLSEEFSLQVDEERALGLPVTQFMDGLRDPCKAAKSTMGFIDFVVQPLMAPMFRTFSLDELKQNLDHNRLTFQEMSEKPIKKHSTV